VANHSSVEGREVEKYQGRKKERKNKEEKEKRKE
jgi:hypothetical protein